MTAETLVFYSDADDPEAWRRALAAELPDLRFRTWKEVEDPAAVRYALVWHPPANFFAPYRNLTLVVNLGAGVDALLKRPDLPPTPICRLSDSGMAAMMASYVLFGVTRYARDMPRIERDKRVRRWQYAPPRSLSAIKVGVLGLGQLGRHAAQELARLDFDVRGWARTPKEVAGVKVYAGDEQLTEFLSGLEIAVCMLPLTAQTRGIIGAAQLAALPRGAKLINVSRGAVVDEPALLAALQSGHIAEATLDVFAVEPLPTDHPFWGMDNVFITPHFASIATPELAARDVAESIRRIRSGREPLHRVDPRRGY